MIEVVVTGGSIGHAKLKSNRHQQQPTPSFLQAGCSSCHPTSSVGAPKGNSLSYLLSLRF